MIWVFGDSWAEGWGLQDNEKCFADFLGVAYNTEVKNLGKSASSMGHITATFAKQAKNFSPGDTVICIIPPDTRWYNLHGEEEPSSIFNGMPEYEKFLEMFNSQAWFTYHHSLFIYTIQNLANEAKVNLLLAHNYGKLVLSNLFPLRDTFLDKEKSLTEYLYGKECWEDNLRPHPNNSMHHDRSGSDLFIPGDNHPSEKGHLVISSLMIAKMEKYYGYTIN